MKIAVIGAGAVGGYFGGRLAQGDDQVSFLVRGTNLRVLREQGLLVESIKGDFRLDTVAATDDPAELGPMDIVLVAVKSWQVVDLAQGLHPMIGPHTLVVPMQNGVTTTQDLAAVLGADHVVGGMCRIISLQAGPGHIRHLGAEPDIHFGTWDGRPDDRLTALRDSFLRVGVKAVISDDIRATIWAKFLFVATMGGVGSLVRAPIGVVRDLPETRALLADSLAEIQALALAHQIPMSAATIEKTWHYLDALPAAATSSLQRDIASGRPSELEAWSGAVVRLGAEKGVATPLHRVIYHALLPHERRARGLLDFAE